MYCGHLIDLGNKSSTIKSYVSAIKMILRTIDHKWNDDRLLIGSLIRACRLRNDSITCQLPIQRGLLELILFQTEKIFEIHPYLSILYKSILCLGYYGLTRIGELVEGSHVIKACNIHIGTNKNKILVVLYSFKTHSRSNYLQQIKITSEIKPNRSDSKDDTVVFCPFRVLQNYLCLRGGYRTENDNFFVFSDGFPVKPAHVRTVLRKCIKNLNLNHTLYKGHSLRIGCSCDLLKAGLTVEQIKQIGRWKSNMIYKYLHQ